MPPLAATRSTADVASGRDGRLRIRLPQPAGTFRHGADARSPVPKSADRLRRREDLTALLAENGFDAEQHEKIAYDLRNGRIGLAQNRLPPNTIIELTSNQPTSST